MLWWKKWMYSCEINVDMFATLIVTTPSQTSWSGKKVFAYTCFSVVVLGYQHINSCKIYPHFSKTVLLYKLLSVNYSMGWSLAVLSLDGLSHCGSVYKILSSLNCLGSPCFVITNFQVYRRQARHDKKSC